MNLQKQQAPMTVEQQINNLKALNLTIENESYAISVRQTRGLPVVSLFPHPASFRFHLTMDTLAFGYILPTTGWIWDLHP